LSSPRRSSSAAAKAVSLCVLCTLYSNQIVLYKYVHDTYKYDKLKQPASRTGDYG
jgi:hypothetical protein